MEWNKTDWTKDELDELGIELLEWLKKEKDNYLITEFFNQKEILYTHTDTWVKKSRCFKQCLDLAKQVQEQRLAKMLTNKAFSSSGIAMVLKNVCGWTETKEIENNTKIEISKDTLDTLRAKYFKKSKD